MLGFLGFLGLLGLPTGNYGFFGFFGFFSFFGVAARGDERLTTNAYRAGYIGFVAAILGMSLLVTALSMGTGPGLLALMIAGVFIAVLVSFVVAFFILERGGG